jgi:hypothetical protein
MDGRQVGVLVWASSGGKWSEQGASQGMWWVGCRRWERVLEGIAECVFWEVQMWRGRVKESRQS